MLRWDKDPVFDYFTVSIIKTPFIYVLTEDLWYVITMLCKTFFVVFEL